jgi:hypothetical protein
MARSTVLEMKLRFDIGRYELRSPGSSVGFFSLGRTMACLIESGNTPSVNDTLHINVIVSANSGRACLTSHVGAGSREQCLDGELLTSFIISAVVIGLMVDRVVHDLASMMGGGALAVAARITSTLLLKKTATSSAVLDDVDVFGGAFRRALIFDHRALESPLLFLIASDQ